MRELVFIALMPVVLVGATAAVAEQRGSRPTREFVEAAAQSDQFEILEGQTAITQAVDPKVRAFAAQMVRDHTDTSRVLEQAAAEAGLAPPVRNVSADQGRMLNALHGLTGAKFDQVYMRHQALAHRAALVAETAYATSGDAAPVRQAAASASPLIAAHLHMAEEMSARLGSP
jgi:putative membrane protein